MNFVVEFITIEDGKLFEDHGGYLSYLKNGRERAMTVRSHRVGCTT